MVREVQHIGPDGQPIVDYNPYGEFPSQSAMGTYGRNGRATNYEHIAAAAAASAAADGSDYRTHSPASEVGSRRYAESAYGRNTYADYEPYPQLGTTTPTITTISSTLLLLLLLFWLIGNHFKMLSISFLMKRWNLSLES